MTSSGARPRPSLRGRPAGAADNRVIRGGSWNNNADNLRATNRNNNTPTNRNNNIGLRCAKTVTCPSQGLPYPCCTTRSLNGSAAITRRVGS
ncbi:MAG: SUMF1/EgtB/PvdO family nonheme iron enzyme [Polyangiaceae bacterium]|nr:SUMF1/EgtB/PvdO family nonheme iron enzyme [Polyangiaceae bacterium]